MAEDYTPTTDEVRSGYGRDDAVRPVTSRRLHAQFDRWLAQVKAEAWDEGYQQGSRDGAEREQQMQMRDWWGEQTTTPNPHRAAETEATR